MKHLLMILLLVYFTPGFAQETQKINISELLKTQKFAFIATEIKKKPGYWGSSGYDSNSYNYDNPAASTVSIQKSLVYTSNPTGGGSYFSEQYYKSAAGDGSYFAARNIPVTNGAKKHSDFVNQAVYFTRDDSNLIISNLENPKSLNDIETNNFALIPLKNIKIKSSNSKDGSTTLKYIIKQKGGSKTFYLNIMKDGKATLQTPPNEKESTYIHGYVIAKS